MGNNNKLGYLFAGLGAGAALGVLFAPNSGKKTRQYLQEKTYEGVDYARRRAEDLRDAPEAVMNSGREVMLAAKDRLSHSVEAGKQAYSEAVSAAPTSPVSAIGVLIEAGILVAAYTTMRGLGKNLHSVLPKMEALLDTSHSAVNEGRERFGELASRFVDVLGVISRATRKV